MTLHYETKTKNINLFLNKDQLLSKAATEGCSSEICRSFENYGPNLLTIPLKKLIWKSEKLKMWLEACNFAKMNLFTGII